MIKEKNLINYIFQLYEALKNAFFAKNIGYSVIRLIFLKYASDNCLGAYTREEMQAYMKVQRIFAARDIEAGPDGILPVLDLLDNYYRLPGLMHNSINEYAKELFGFDESWVKRNATSKDFTEIMSIISSMDLTDDTKTHKNGKMLAFNLITFLRTYCMNIGTKFGNCSRRELGYLARKILNVSDSDVFVDFCSGIGTTTIDMTLFKKCKIINRDINEESLTIAAMLYMMSGYEDFDLAVQDVFEMNTNESKNHEVERIADKIFVEPPIGIKYKEHPIRDIALIALKKAASMLRENGRAIVVVPANTLSSRIMKNQKFRETLISAGHIHSVVALPFTYPRTSIAMYMIVLTYESNNEILFTNFATNRFRHVMSRQRTFALSDGITVSFEDMDEMARILLCGEEMEGIAKKVLVSEIVNKNYNLLPVDYIDEVIEYENVSIKEIDDELDILYTKLLKMTTNVRRKRE